MQTTGGILITVRLSKQQKSRSICYVLTVHDLCSVTSKSLMLKPTANPLIDLQIGSEMILT